MKVDRRSLFGMVAGLPLLKVAPAVAEIAPIYCGYKGQVYRVVGAGTTGRAPAWANYTDTWRAGHTLGLEIVVKNKA